MDSQASTKFRQIFPRGEFPQVFAKWTSAHQFLLPSQALNTTTMNPFITVACFAVLIGCVYCDRVVQLDSEAMWQELVLQEAGKVCLLKSDL